MKTLKDILTSRQFQITELISAGFSNEEIARQLNSRLQGIKNHSRRIYEKTGCSRADRGQMIPRVELAVRYAIEEERGLYV